MDWDEIDVDEDALADDADVTLDDFADDEEFYNLDENATVDCLYGDCDHFCGEPTQADLDRLVARGYADAVDAYESGRTVQFL